MNLSQLKPNQSAKIVKLDFDDVRLKRRICDLGIFEGEQVVYLKTSVLKKVVLIELKNFVLCIKTDIAKQIEVKIE